MQKKLSDNKFKPKLSSEDLKKKKEQIERKEQTDRIKSIACKILKFLGILTGIIILIGMLIVGKIGFENQESISQLFKDAKEMVENVTPETFNSRQPTKVYDKNGELIYEFKENSYEYKKLNELNPYAMKAFMAIEDARFMSHNGIDYKGTARAMIFTLAGSSVQGGSSITQQLAKNVFLTHEQTLARKIKEAVIASHLERKFTKEQIFEFYANNIYYGYGAYSFESASKYYFQKTNKDLSIGQVAILAGVINNPTKYDPIRNPENAKHRRDRILEKMEEEGFITKEQYEQEVAKDLEVNPGERDLDNTITDDTVSYAIDCATKVFMEQNGFQFQYEFKDSDERVNYWKYYSEEYNTRRKELLTGGYEIHTVIDKNLDKKLLEIANKHLKGFTAKSSDGVYKKQVSLTAIDNATGQVVSMVGGRGQENDFLNRAYQAPRQPGSTIKPLVAYAPAFARGYIPSSVMVDAPVENGPKNAGGGYSGAVTLRHALEKSINTIPYRLASSMGGDVALSYLVNMQFKTLTHTDKNPIIAVGGFTKGVTTEEMASGFSTLSRGGEFIKPSNLSKIVKINTGEVVYENNLKDQAIRVYDEGASYLTTDSLKGVLTQGTGVRFKPEYPHVAGKTGTTNAKKDSWMLGYTPYYTIAVWVGDDKPTPQGTTTIAGSIWRESMNLLNKGKKVIDFKKPDSVKIHNGVLVNDIYLNKKDNSSSKRKKKEEERIKQEKALQLERLASEDYRIIHGITKEEELRREGEAEKALSILKSYVLVSKSQFGELEELLSDTKAKISEVKHKKAYDKYMSTYNSLKRKLNSIKYDILNPKPIIPEEPEVETPDVNVPQEPENNEGGSSNNDSNNGSSNNGDNSSNGSTNNENSSNGDNSYQDSNTQ